MKSQFKFIGMIQQLFLHGKKSDGKEKNYLPQPQKILNISTKSLQLILKKRT